MLLAYQFIKAYWPPFTVKGHICHDNSSFQTIYLIITPNAFMGKCIVITINIHPRSGWFFIFGHSPYTISCPQVGTECLPACDCYLLPVNGSLGSNKLNWSDSLSTFSWFAMYSLIAFVFFPTVST